LCAGLFRSRTLPSTSAPVFLPTGYPEISWVPGVGQSDSTHRQLNHRLD
jgi:hypothetical protein